MVNAVAKVVMKTLELFNILALLRFESLFCPATMKLFDKEIYKNYAIIKFQKQCFTLSCDGKISAVITFFLFKDENFQLHCFLCFIY